MGSNPVYLFKSFLLYIKYNDLTYLTNVLDLIGASEWKEIKDEFLFEATTIFSLEDMSTLAISASEAGLESLILSRLNSHRFGPSPG